MPRERIVLHLAASGLTQASRVNALPGSPDAFVTSTKLAPLNFTAFPKRLVEGSDWPAVSAREPGGGGSRSTFVENGTKLAGTGTSLTGLLLRTWVALFV